MSGLGRKVFTAGEVLAASDVNGYLMDQSVMVFADEAARTSAIGTPTEGMFSYTSDDDAFEYWDGSAWQPVSNPGDITAVIAGTALTGGGSSGDVTLDVDLSAVGSGIAINATQIEHTITSSTATTYTIASSDANKYLQFTAGAVTLTVGSSTDFSIGEQVTVLNDGTALTILPEGTGVELYGRGTAAGTAGFLAENQYDAFSIVCVGTDAYRIIGNVGAI